MNESSDNNLNIIAVRLKEARQRAGISQEKLGVLAGIDEFSASARINQYERGKHVPDLFTLERLAKVLDTPAPYFYATDNDLAGWILMFNKIDGSEKPSMSI